MESRKTVFHPARITVFVISTLLGINVVEGGPGDKRLLHTLFSDYSNHSIPVKAAEKTMEVVVYYDLNHIVDVDLKHEVFRANIWINLYWLDYQLEWNPRDFNGSSILVIPPTMLWTPKLHLINSVSYANDKIMVSEAKLNYTGAVHWFTNGQFSASCDINVKWFPYDQQTCELTFVSLFDRSDLQLITYPNESDGFKGRWRSGLDFDGEWNVLHEVTDCKQQKLMNGFEYETAVFRVSMRRRPLYYEFNLILPCAMISFLALLSFKIPPDVGDKLGLSVTVLLALVVFQLVVADKIPPTPKAVPMIGVYFMVLMILCTLSVIANIIVLGFYHRPSNILEMPVWVRVLFCEWLAYLLGVKKPCYKPICKTGEKRLGQTVNNHDTDAEKMPSTVSNHADTEDLIGDWKFVAIVLDNVFFWMFSLFFVIGTAVIFSLVPK